MMHRWKRATFLYWAAIIASLCGMLVLLATLLAGSIIILVLTLAFFILSLAFLLVALLLRTKR